MLNVRSTSSNLPKGQDYIPKLPPVDVLKYCVLIIDQELLLKMKAFKLVKIALLELPALNKNLLKVEILNLRIQLILQYR